MAKKNYKALKIQKNPPTVVGIIFRLHFLFINFDLLHSFHKFMLTKYLTHSLLEPPSPQRKKIEKKLSKFSSSTCCLDIVKRVYARNETNSI